MSRTSQFSKFQSISANKIEEWANRHEARDLLSVFLRRLIYSNSRDISALYFPGYDNSQQHGWDGWLEASRSTTWIPYGKSGWEFGCRRDYQRKAQEDYENRIAKTPADERKEITFVFVTPRKWPSKEKWSEEKRNEREWRNVKVYDAIDLETWLEQEVPVRAWFAERLGIDSESIQSVEKAWHSWSEATKPPLPMGLFKPAIKKFGKQLEVWLQSSSPDRMLTVSADSHEEALAFVCAFLLSQTVFEGNSNKFQPYADRSVIISKQQGISMLEQSLAPFIAIINDPIIARDMGGFFQRFHTIAVLSKDSLSIRSDIVLDQLQYLDYKEALETVNFTDINSLTQKRTLSITELRELCSRNPFIKNTHILPMPIFRSLNMESQSNSMVIGRVTNNLKDDATSQLSKSSYLATGLIDQEIEKGVEILRKTRFFGEVDRANNALLLGKRIKGELSGGTDALRSHALAWCARLLATSKWVDTGKEYLELARQLGICPEIGIAEAFVVSHAGDKEAALNILAAIDKPSARSAAFMVVTHHEGAKGAIDWLQSAGIDSSDLDSEGKFFLLSQQLELALWEAAEETASKISNHELNDTPVLHHSIAITYLLMTVPVEFRSLVAKQLPLDSRRLPLASDASSMNVREKAFVHFSKAAEIARQLNCPRIASIDDEYALWLELRNPKTVDAGRTRLESKLRFLKSNLQFVPLGLNFGIDLDFAAIEKEIERNIALHGGITPEAAIARFALAFTQKSPKDIVNYVERHYDDLLKFFGEKLIGTLQIEALSRAGMPDKAEQRLLLLLKNGLSKEEEAPLRRIVSEASGEDPIKLRKELFEQTNSLNDLIALVDELHVQQNWFELCEFGDKLFQRTHSVADAERLAMALSNVQKNDDLVEFLTHLHDLRQQSKNLQMYYCWSLYNQGQLIEARAELAKLSDMQDDWNYRALSVNLGIALGDWSSLSAYVADEYQARDDRDASDLIQTARLAHHLDSPQARDLTLLAATKGNEDPEVFTAAYHLAATAGWEDDEVAVQWLQKAIHLSGEHGALQRMTLKDLVDLKPEWDRHESKTGQMLGRGEIPMFLAGKALNRTLVSLMLFPALVNRSERDPRRRVAISAYSGGRHLSAADITRKTIGMDASALLTLGFLNLLDEALDVFETVYVPHSTMIWLLEEKQRTTFHQPSRIRDARQVRDMLATGALENFTSSTIADRDLSAHVGGDLAMLITEAKKIRDEDGAQRIVVRPSPVPRLGSLMDEEADLTKYADVISSCLAVVDKLKQKGHITVAEEEKARTYLQIHEKSWPQQPDISDDAVLYLDGLAINYFLHIGILNKLKAAGFTALVSQSELSEFDALISYESNSDKVNEVIERIRNNLKSRIESGQVKIGKRYIPDIPDEYSMLDHPTAGVFALAEVCDSVVIDDRFINQHAEIGGSDVETTTLSTLDLFDVLVSADVITSEQMMEYRTRLRQAGYIFIPVREDELNQHLSACSIVNGKVRETAELKAIRESLLHVRMSDCLQLPKEARWLDTTITVFVNVLKKLWKPDADISKVNAISDWIEDQIDIRGWTHRLDVDVANDIIKTGRGNHLLLLLTSPIDATENIRDAYWKWLEGRVLNQIKEQFPELYNWTVDYLKQQFPKWVDMDFNVEGMDMTSRSNVRSLLANLILERLPPLIQKTLLDQRDFRKEYGFKFDATVKFVEAGISIRRSNLFKAIRSVLAGHSEAVATDTNGHDWKIFAGIEGGEQKEILISINEQQYNLPDFMILSPNDSTRLRSLQETASDVNLPADVITSWRDILSMRELEEEEVELLQNEFQDTPVRMAQSVRAEIHKENISIPSLVPSSRRYFTRLIGEYDESSSIWDYAAGTGKNFIEKLSAWQAYDGFLFSLLLSSHSALTDKIGVERLDDKDIVRAFEFLLERKDRISQLGAIEVGLRILPEMPEIEASLISLVEQIRDDNVDEHASGFKLLSALFTLVDGELSRTRLFPNVPPFFRRLASLTQAALIQREIVIAPINIDSFCERTLNIRAEQFYFQSLADMRLEPRWVPDFASPSQMKVDFFGRLMIAGRKYEKNIPKGELRRLLLDSDPGSLHHLIDTPQLYFPGPLEGEEVKSNALPDELRKTVNNQLKADEVTPSSFIALVNSSLIFNVDQSQMKMAAQALRIGNHRIANIENRHQLLAVLQGLATVAAVSRGQLLADEVRILLRRYRQDKQYALSIDEALRIGIVASASRHDLKDWGDNAGAWLTELAFGDFQDTESSDLYSRLHYLRHAVPELWISCGRADAALLASLGK